VTCRRCEYTARARRCVAVYPVLAAGASRAVRALAPARRALRARERLIQTRIIASSHRAIVRGRWRRGVAAYQQKRSCGRHSWARCSRATRTRLPLRRAAHVTQNVGRAPCALGCERTRWRRWMRLRRAHSRMKRWCARSETARAGARERR